MKNELDNLSHRIGYSPPRNGICYISELAAAALIGAGAATASTGANIAMSGKMNRRAARQAAETRAWQTSERLASQEYQTERYNQQILDTERMRDYDNWYNSIEQQKQRMLDAGFSPMSALGNMGNSSSSAEPMNAPGTPSDPGASLPQVFNPSGALSQGIHDFSNFMQTYLNNEKTKADIVKAESEADKNAAETATLDALRQGQIQLQGVELDLKGSQKELTDKQREALAAQIVKTNTEIEVAQQYMQYMGCQMRYMEFMKWLQKQDFDVRSKEIASRIALNLQMSSESKYRQANIAVDTKFKNMSFDDRLYQVQSQRWRTSQENDVLYDYYKNNYGKKANKRADMLGDYQIKNIPSDLSIAVRQGMATVSSILQPVGQIFSAYSQFAVGNYYTTKRSQMLNSTFQNGNLMTDPVDGGTFWNSQNW